MPTRARSALMNRSSPVTSSPPTRTSQPVVRLNVESRGDQALMEAKTQELLDLMARLDGAASV